MIKFNNKYCLCFLLVSFFFCNEKDPWNTEDEVKQKVNDFIVSIFDVMSDDEWLDKYTGLSQKAILKYAKTSLISFLS